MLKRKLLIPTAWQGAIPRTRAISILEAALGAGRHAALIAGTGYGKTAMLARWARECAYRVGWIGLDAEDANLDTFLAYLLAACEGLWTGFSTEAADLLAQARERDGAMATLSALLSDLDEFDPPPSVLVLDDYHLAGSESLDRLIARLVKYLPPSVRLVLSSRQVPEMGIATLQAKRELSVIGESELAFDLAEVSMVRPGVSDAEAAHLLSSTGGWPAAFGMGPDLADAYIEEQVLGSQTDAIRAVLERLAMVGAFDAALCEEVLEAPLPRATEDWLVRQRLILRVDEGRWRVAPPLQPLLSRRFCERTSREARLALLRRVGDHLWRTGQESTALRYLIDAGAAQLAAERLAEVGQRWLAENRLEALANALQALGEAIEIPALRLLEGEVHRRWGDFERAEGSYALALAGFEAGSDLHGAARVHLCQAMVAAARGRVADARSRLAVCGPDLGDQSALLADRLNVEGGLALLSGESLQAVERFEASMRLARRAQDVFGAARAAHNLGVCHTRLGAFARALECYELAWSGDKTPVVWMTPINRALVLIYLGRVAEARDAAERALSLVRRFRHAREEGYALRTLGYAQVRLGAYDQAAACFESAERLARYADDPLGIAYSLNFRADLAALLGDHDAALSLSEQAVGIAGGQEVFARIPEFAHVRAKILVVAGRRGEAAPLVEELDAMARQQGYRYLAQEVAVLRRSLERGTRALELAGSMAASAPEPRPELTIQCFGRLRVQRAGADVGEREWQSARAKQLLAFLVHHPDGATKPALLEMLYPNETPTDASLNMNIMRLRKALEPGLERGQPSHFILRSEGRYTFNWQTRTLLDTRTFEMALTAARLTRDEEAIAPLRAALAAYQGEFLPEFDASWVVALRQRYKDLAIEACRRLLALLDHRFPEAHEEAGEVLRRALDIDPLSAEFHRELILRFIEMDEPHRALEQYRACEQRFQELLGQPPPADLVELVADLGNGASS